MVHILYIPTPTIVHFSTRIFCYRNYARLISFTVTIFNTKIIHNIHKNIFSNKELLSPLNAKIKVIYFFIPAACFVILEDVIRTQPRIFI